MGGSWAVHGQCAHEIKKKENGRQKKKVGETPVFFKLIFGAQLWYIPINKIRRFLVVPSTAEIFLRKLLFIIITLTSSLFFVRNPCFFFSFLFYNWNLSYFASFWATYNFRLYFAFNCYHFPRIQSFIELKL